MAHNETGGTEIAVPISHGHHLIGSLVWLFAYWSAQLLCAQVSLLQHEIANLRNMFLKNGYPSRFFDEVLCNQWTIWIQVLHYYSNPFIEQDSKQFAHSVAQLARKHFDAKTLIYCFVWCGDHIHRYDYTTLNHTGQQAFELEW